MPVPPAPPSRPFQPHYPYAIAPLSFAVFLFPCRFFLPFRSYPFYAGAHGRDQSFFRSRGVEFCSTLVNGDDRKGLWTERFYRSLQRISRCFTFCTFHPWLFYSSRFPPLFFSLFSPFVPPLLSVYANTLVQTRVYSHECASWNSRTKKKKACFSTNVLATMLYCFLLRNMRVLRHTGGGGRGVVDRTEIKRVLNEARSDLGNHFVHRRKDIGECNIRNKIRKIIPLIFEPSTPFSSSTVRRSCTRSNLFFKESSAKGVTLCFDRCLFYLRCQEHFQTNNSPRFGRQFPIRRVTACSDVSDILADN